MFTEESTFLHHKDVISGLSHLGLSENEAEVYLAILELGEVTAGMILERVPLHREQVYRALRVLTSNSVITSYTKGKRSFYTALSPEILIRKQEERAALAKGMLPYLSRLQQNRPQIIQIKEGADAFEKMLDDILETLPKGSEYLVLGGVGELFYEYTRDILPKYSRRFAKKDIKVRIIAFEGQSYEKEQKLIHSEIKTFDQPMGGPTATVIYGNKVAIEVFNPDNLAVITIDNKFVADSYRQTFESVWKLCK